MTPVPDILNDSMLDLPRLPPPAEEVNRHENDQNVEEAEFKEELPDPNLGRNFKEEIEYGFSLLKAHFKPEELLHQTISGKRGHTSLDGRMLKVIEGNIKSNWGITKKEHIKSIFQGMSKKLCNHKCKLKKAIWNGSR